MKNYNNKDLIQYCNLLNIDEHLTQFDQESKIQINDFKLKHELMNIENKKNKFKVTLNYKSDLLLMGDFDPGLIENYFS